MENAGKEDMPGEAERKGLGTPATRAAIIEKLVSGGFMERKGKNLIPTKAGINLVTVLPELLTSPNDAVVILDDTGGKYVNFKLEFPKRKDGVYGKK